MALPQILTLLKLLLLFHVFSWKTVGSCHVLGAVPTTNRTVPALQQRTLTKQKPQHSVASTLWWWLRANGTNGTGRGHQPAQRQLHTHCQLLRGVNSEQTFLSFSRCREHVCISSPSVGFLFKCTCFFVQCLFLILSILYLFFFHLKTISSPWMFLSDCSLCEVPESSKLPILAIHCHDGMCFWVVIFWLWTFFYPGVPETWVVEL